MESGIGGYKHHTAACRQRMEAALNAARHPKFERALERKLEFEASTSPTLERSISGPHPSTSSSSGLTPSERKLGREAQDEDQQDGKRLHQGLAGSDSVAPRGTESAEGLTERAVGQKRAHDQVQEEPKRSRVEEPVEVSVHMKRSAEDAGLDTSQDAQSDSMILDSLNECLLRIAACEYVHRHEYRRCMTQIPPQGVTDIPNGSFPVTF